MRLGCSLAAASTIALVVASFVGLKTLRGDPKLFAYVEPGDPTVLPAWIMFNPLRDREPERRAESFLQLLATGRGEQAFARLKAPPSQTEEWVAAEVRHPLLSWRLVDRNDVAGRVRLSYETNRHLAPDLTVPVWLTLERHANDWVPVEFEAYY